MEPAPVSRDALDFQDDLDALVSEPAPLVLRLWPALGGAMILGLIAAAALTRVDVVVTATGRLVSEAPPVVLQPMGAAVLRELRVRPGEAVEAGRVLAVLDSTLTAADRETLEAQRRALAARGSAGGGAGRDRSRARRGGPRDGVAERPARQPALGAGGAARHDLR